MTKLKPLIALASIPLWFAYTTMCKSSGQVSYFQQLMWKNPYRHSLGTITAWDMIVRIGQNVWLLIDRVLPQMFLHWGNWIVGIVIVCLILTGIGGKIGN